MAFRLGDDGTMDTVIVCTECGQELRYNYDPSMAMADEEREPTEAESEAAYQSWIDEILLEAADDHECESTPDDTDA